MKLRITLIILFVGQLLLLKAQLPILPINSNYLLGKTPIVNGAFNRIEYPQNLDNLFNKLVQLKTNPSVINIVQIGDSHTQPDFISSVVRYQLQQQWGDAGRGIVFPYQLANSNAPADVQSSSNINWQFSRIAKPDTNGSYGVAGFEIYSNNEAANISFSLSNKNNLQYFETVKVFSDTASQWQLKPQDDTIFMPHFYKNGVFQFSFPKPISAFTLSSINNTTTKKIYGFSLEKNNTGIRYHNIGVNGAQYKQYNASVLFWQQLSTLAPDCIIVSLGTNEAQKNDLNIDSFKLAVKTFIDSARAIAPQASVMITTPANSLKGGRANPMIVQINKAINEVCMANNIPLWDFYKAGGRTPLYWIKKGLMAKDQLHFNKEGYLLQGQLLYNALATAFNNYLTTKIEGK